MANGLPNPQFRFHVTKCINFCVYDRWCRIYDVSFLNHEKCMVVNIVSAISTTGHSEIGKQAIPKYGIFDAEMRAPL